MSSSARSEKRVRFGVFELDLVAGELRKGSARVPLAEQPLRLLELLVERPGEVVTRDQLRDRLWGADTFVDFEHGLNAAIKRLRDALGDSAEHPHFIETVPKRGYRFIAAVDGTSAPGAPAPDAAAAPAPPKRRAAWPVAAVVCVSAAAVAAAWWVAARHDAPAPV